MMGGYPRRNNDRRRNSHWATPATAGRRGDSQRAADQQADAPVRQPPPITSCTPAVVAANLAVAKTKIQHVVIINQENRSFDHYFGTFPGADGIPMDDAGVPSVCVVDPKTKHCVKPYHDTNATNAGGPHSATSFTDCVGDGGMRRLHRGPRRTTVPASRHLCDAGDIDPNCQYGTTTDVMGYHTDGEIPNYWGYARNFVLQDHMFEPVASYSLPDHLYMVSGWAASCTPANDPLNCVSNLDNPGNEHSGSPRVRVDRPHLAAPPRTA